MDLGIAGRWALVCAASRGLGYGCARALAGEGVNLVINARTGQPLREAAARIGGETGVTVIAVACDITTEAGRAESLAAAPQLDILVNNAGGPPPGTTLPRFGFLTPTDDDWQAMFEFNLFSAVRTIRAAVPVMLERGGGVIINVSTGMARQPAAMNVDYAAANAGLNALTQALSEEYAPQGIRVNTISPGAVRTAWWTEDGGAADIIAAQMGTDRETVLDSLAPQLMRQTTGRLIDPQEIADAIAVLASPRSASTTGADFAIDAGFLKAV